MRICLVRLPSPYLNNERAFPPLNLLTIATVLKQYHDVYVYDGDISEVPFGFDAYGFGPSVTEYGYALKVMKRIRKYDSSARLVIGGPHATLNKGDCIRDGFDCVVLKDGEPMANAAFEPNAEKILYGHENPNIDSFPIADRTFIDLSKYGYLINGENSAPVVSSRGCPYRCAFCSRMYSKVRMCSAEKVIREIDYLHDELGYKAVMFFDDTFIVDKQRVKRIAEYLSSIGIVWRCLVRGDLIDRYGPSFSEMLAENRCVEVGMGIESGSDRILKNIRKGESIRQIRSAISILKSTGIRVKGFFIIGLPGEDQISLGETEEFVRSVNLDDMDFSIYKPYAGSDIHSHKERYDVDWDDMLYEDTFYKGNGRENGGNIRTSRLSHDDIVSAMYHMENTYKPMERRGI